MIAEFIGTFTLIFAGVGAIAVTAPLGARVLCRWPSPRTGARGDDHRNRGHQRWPPQSGGHLRRAARRQDPAPTGHRALGCPGAGRHGRCAGDLCVPAGGHARQGRLRCACARSRRRLADGGVHRALLTFSWCSSSLGSAIDDRAPKVGGLFIGLTVAMDILVGGPLTGAAMNPARFLGPAIVYATDLQYTWIYLLGPLLGAAWRASSGGTCSWRGNRREPDPRQPDRPHVAETTRVSHKNT